ncbi:MAG: radical SAM protein [Gemmiger sp.]|nr:radical SAM protein [Gemmiger sp.]
MSTIPPLPVPLPTHCTLCPRRCGANRRAGQVGFCGGGSTLLAARAALHHWEEPCLSGPPDVETGSGTVFFTGCALKCCYCQNYAISQQGLGKPLTAERLAAIFLELQAKGAINLNLVTATQWLPWVLPALDAARAQGLHLPVVYNTGGYETVETVKALDGYVDVWLADIKYQSGVLAARLSGAEDYNQVCLTAVAQMLRQTGAPQTDAAGYLARGVILRHLVLPGQAEDSIQVLHQMAALRQTTGVAFIPSLMSQFTPFYHAEAAGLGRRVTSYEYRKVIDAALALGLTDGYMQEKSSAREEYTPPFDLEGV